MLPATPDFTRDRRDALLEPSLTGQAAVSLYSARAGFVVSALGGPLAALAMGWLNARLLGRLSKDAWLLAALAAVTLALLASVTGATSEGTEGIRWLGVSMQRRDMRLVAKAFGLLTYLAIYVRHKPFHRAMLFAGVAPRKPWVTGLVLVLGAGVAQAAWVGVWVVFQS